jgi:hypothetical protein
MSNTQGTVAVIAAAAAIGLAVPYTGARLAAAAGASRPRWNSFSADVIIRRGVHGPAHQPEGSDPTAVAYRWERTYEGGRWKSIVRVVTSGRVGVVAPTGKTVPIPPVIGRIEEDDDGTGPRFYTSEGTLVTPPAIADRRKMGVAEAVFANSDAFAGLPVLSGAPRTPRHLRTVDPDWLDTILPPPGLKEQRRDGLQRRYGKPLGTVGGWQRYVQESGDQTTEVLADADWAVPVEVRVLRRGMLTTRASFSFESGPGGSLVRRRSRSERLMPEGKGARMVLDVELANVKLEDRK